MSKRIPLTQGQFAIVDDADYEWLNQWHWHAVNFRGAYYAARTPRKNEGIMPTMVYMHRLIAGTGLNLRTHHFNKDGLDNRRSNLHVCTRKGHKEYHCSGGLGKKDIMPFARNLKMLRNIRKLTRAELADKAMTSQAFIGYLETEKMLPTPYLEECLRRALGWGSNEDKAFRLLSGESE